MAGKGGGGAWKVAYADFVTAMMAFFLVMWLVGQDQKMRGAVSHYFNDPFDTSKIGTSKRPTRAGSVAELNNPGNVPDADSAALAQGRKSYTPEAAKATATKLVSDWLRGDGKSMRFWQDEARQAQARAAEVKDVQEKLVSAERVAVMHLSKRLKNEISSEIASEAKGVQQELLFEILYQVNWTEIAEDLLSR